MQTRKKMIFLQNHNTHTHTHTHTHTQMWSSCILFEYFHFCFVLAPPPILLLTPLHLPMLSVCQRLWSVSPVRHAAPTGGRKPRRCESLLQWSSSCSCRESHMWRQTESASDLLTVAMTTDALFNNLSRKSFLVFVPMFLNSSLFFIFCLLCVSVCVWDTHWYRNDDRGTFTGDNHIFLSV